MRREDWDTAPGGYKLLFDKLCIRWVLVFIDAQIAVPFHRRTILLDILHFGNSRNLEHDDRSKDLLVTRDAEDIDQKAKHCTACLATGKNIRYQIWKNHYESWKFLTESGQVLQKDFNWKLHNKTLNVEPQIVFAIVRFSKWPAATSCVRKRQKQKNSWTFQWVIINILISKANTIIHRRGIHFK